MFWLVLHEKCQHLPIHRFEPWQSTVASDFNTGCLLQRVPSQLLFNDTLRNTKSDLGCTHTESLVLLTKMSAREQSASRASAQLEEVARGTVAHTCVLAKTSCVRGVIRNKKHFETTVGNVFQINNTGLTLLRNSHFSQTKSCLIMTYDPPQSCMGMERFKRPWCVHP